MAPSADGDEGAAVLARGAVAAAGGRDRARPRLRRLSVPEGDVGPGMAPGVRRRPARRGGQPDGAGAPRAADVVAGCLRRPVVRSHEAVELQRVPGAVGARGAGRAGAPGRPAAGRVAAGRGAPAGAWHRPRRRRRLLPPPAADRRLTTAGGGVPPSWPAPSGARPAPPRSPAPRRGALPPRRSVGAGEGRPGWPRAVTCTRR